ncbi:hypothetical protein QJS66_08530 [Kocuria rhizophila]|nr:hypothetical protein QJS66_08530 [Kocuria rhizophila]
MVPEVVSGDEEAALSFRGALNAAPGLDPRTGCSWWTWAAVPRSACWAAPREVLASPQRGRGVHAHDEGAPPGSNPPAEEQQAHVLRDVDEAMDVVARTVPLEQTTRPGGSGGHRHHRHGHRPSVSSATRPGPHQRDGAGRRGHGDRACRELTAMTPQAAGTPGLRARGPGGRDRGPERSCGAAW